jgi:hypothetical protein
MSTSKKVFSMHASKLQCASRGAHLKRFEIDLICGVAVVGGWQGGEGEPIGLVGVQGLHGLLGA